MADAHGRDLILRGCGVVVAASAAGGLAAYLAASGGGTAPAIAAAALLSALAAGAGVGAILMRPFHRVLDAISAALLSYRDDDYTVRLTAVPGLRDLVDRFNQLGRRLRQDRNTLY